MITQNLVVAEFSTQQDCFHIQSLKGAIEDNLLNSLMGEPSEFCIIGMFNTDSEAHEYIEKVRSKLQKQTV